ncbi:hypothetical protein GCK72_022574 [Caenorhabditis remanei]|nr:hypothetical protein GCK72_022574 [Caenorhabditis remanei]KAF1746122.1 hypothetical protein GCK72_022574 [Caenorhabditis remanei]
MVRVRPPKPLVRARKSLPASGGVMNPSPNHSPTSAPVSVQTTPTRPAPASRLAAAAQRSSSRPRDSSRVARRYLSGIERPADHRASAPRRTERVSHPAPSKEYNPCNLPVAVAEPKTKTTAKKPNKTAKSATIKKTKK